MNQPEWLWAEKATKTKKNLPGILLEENSDTLLPLSISHSTNSSFPPHPSLSPHSLYPPPLTPGLLFCRSSSFSFHLPASESLMPAMSWSVWMWAAFRMIIPAHCVRLIPYSLLHTSCRRPTLNIVFHQIVRMWLPCNGKRQEPVDADTHITNYRLRHISCNLSGKNYFTKRQDLFQFSMFLFERIWALPQVNLFIFCAVVHYATKNSRSSPLTLAFRCAQTTRLSLIPKLSSSTSKDGYILKEFVCYFKLLPPCCEATSAPLCCGLYPYRILDMFLAELLQNGWIQCWIAVFLVLTSPYVKVFNSVCWDL